MGNPPCGQGVPLTPPLPVKHRRHIDAPSAQRVQRIRSTRVLHGWPFEAVSTMGAGLNTGLESGWCWTYNRLKVDHSVQICCGA